MYFDFLLDVDVPGNPGKRFGQDGTAQKLHESCCSAERNARINPDQCILNIRQSIEILTKALIIEDGGSIEMKSLNDCIMECRWISKGVFHKLRKFSNRVVHNGNDSSINHSTVQQACENLFDLYRELVRLFHPKLQNKLNNIEYLPIGDYEVIKPVDAQKYEPVVGGKNFFCKKTGSDIDSYAYVRPFDSESNNASEVFKHRDLEIQNFFANMRGSNSIIRGHEIGQKDSPCDIRYLAYEIQKDTKTLDMLERNSLPAKTVLEIISQITDGLMALSTKSINIHHRCIRPSCIFINKYEDDYEAKLGCFETAKIEYKERDMRTVMAYMAEAQKGNPFVHPELREKAQAEDIEWEKGDVYSLGAVLLFCIDQDTVLQGFMDYSCLYDSYSEEFCEAMSDILKSNSLEQVSTLDEFSEILHQEIDKL